jgi:hypothetical protein
MALIGKLKALNVAREKRSGMYGDGGGLHLQVTDSESKTWIFRYRVAARDPVTGELVRDPAKNKIKGRAREMGIGSYITVSLAEVRSPSHLTFRRWAYPALFLCRRNSSGMAAFGP